MADQLWKRLVTPQPAAGGWEIFHENSKITRFSSFPGDAEVRARMAAQWQALPMARAPGLPLPDAVPEGAGAVTAAIRARRTPQDMTAAPMPLASLATLLGNMGGAVPGSGAPDRPFRTAPSGGALYPLESYVLARTVEGLAPGLHYFDAVAHALHPLRGGDLDEAFGACLVQPGIVADSAAIVVVTAVFPRATFKYGDRGYRFALIEAGHQAQNLALTATALGLGVIPVGGYRDHALDAFLDIDGVAQSAIYVAAIGRPEAAS
jgi:SagB-type dehydrogenase family enzyme